MYRPGMKLRSSSRRLVIGPLVVFFVAGAFLVNAEPAHACSASSNPGAYAYGSALGTDALIVCASTASGAKAGSPGGASSTTVGQAKPRVVATPPKPTTTCRIVTKAVFLGPPTYATRYVDTPVCVSNAQLPPPSKPASPTGVTTIKQATPTVPAASSSDQSSFRPDPIQLWAASSLLHPGELVDLIAKTTTHLKQAVILGQSVTVRFTPTLVRWNFGDGPTGWLDIAAATQTRTFAYSGSQSVSATVRFTAAFRFAGQSGWTSQAGYLPSDDSVTLVIADQPPGPSPAAKPNKPRVRLVVNNCQTQPSSLGCP